MYSFKNDSAMYYVPKKNHNSFWPVKDMNTSKMQPLQMGMGSTSDCNDRVWCNTQSKTGWDRRNIRNLVNLFCSPIQNKVGISFCHCSSTRFILLNSYSSQLWDAAFMPHVLWRVPFGIRNNFCKLKSSWEGLLFILKASYQGTVWDGGKITSDLE